jgi:hypothetical protein
MKPAILPFLMLVLCLAACTAGKPESMPKLATIEDGRVGTRCASIFPEGSWQFSHVIEFSLGDGSGSTVIGVTSLSGGEIACALMTVEGFTLFEAVSRQDGEVEVRRSVAPFDNSAFGEGLLRDVRLIFRPPSFTWVRYGRLDDNTPVCRYTDAAGRITDILFSRNDCWQIRTFTPEHIPDRRVAARSCRRIAGASIPQYLELENFSRKGYTLKMTLLNTKDLN